MGPDKSDAICPTLAVEYSDWFKFRENSSVNPKAWCCVVGTCDRRYSHKSGLVKHLEERHETRLGTLRKRTRRWLRKHTKPKRKGAGRRGSYADDSDFVNDSSWESVSEEGLLKDGQNPEDFDRTASPNPFDGNCFLLEEFQNDWGTVSKMWGWKKARQYSIEWNAETKMRQALSGPRQPKRPPTGIFTSLFSEIVERSGLHLWTCLVEVEGMKKVLTLLEDSVDNPEVFDVPIKAIDEFVNAEFAVATRVGWALGDDNYILRECVKLFSPLYSPQALPTVESGMRAIRELFAEEGLIFVRQMRARMEWEQRWDSASMLASVRQRYTAWKNLNKSRKCLIYGDLIIHTLTHWFKLSAEEARTQGGIGADIIDESDVEYAARVARPAGPRVTTNAELYLSNSADEKGDSTMKADPAGCTPKNIGYEARLTRSGARMLAAHRSSHMSEVTSEAPTPCGDMPIVVAPSDAAYVPVGGSPELQRPTPVIGENKLSLQDRKKAKKKADGGDGKSRCNGIFMRNIGADIDKVTVGNDSHTELLGDDLLGNEPFQDGHMTMESQQTLGALLIEPSPPSLTQLLNSMHDGFTPPGKQAAIVKKHSVLSTGVGNHSDLPSPSPDTETNLSNFVTPSQLASLPLMSMSQWPAFTFSSIESSMEEGDIANFACQSASKST